WIEFFFQKIIVMQRNPLEFERDLEQRIILAADFAKNLVAGLLHDLGARIVMLVHAMPEAHQAETVVGVLRSADKFRNALRLADLSEHVQRRLVGAAMRRSPQAGATGCDARKRIGAR